jgi:predicted nucleic-acid-binding Zn-ribbon protein
VKDSQFSNAAMARPIPGVLFSDQGVDSLIRQALSSRRTIGLRLNDIQENIFSNLACKTCGQSGYTITVYTPEEWIQLAARQARKEMLPFSASDVSPVTRLPLLHVNALPSIPDYLTGTGFAGASSVHRVVLTDTSGRVTVQPIDLSRSEVETNSAYRSATFGTAVAAFRMADVDSLRRSDPKGEFFIVVVGDKQNKYFKVKTKHFQALFGTNAFVPTAMASAATLPTP